MTTSRKGSGQVAADQSDDLQAGANGPVVDPGLGDQSGLRANMVDAGTKTISFTFINTTGETIPTTDEKKIIRLLIEK